jgi:hypothetical protein
MNNYLDLLSIAIGSLTNPDSEKLNQRVKTSKSAPNQENLSNLVRVITDKARDNQELIRRAVNLWENIVEQNQSPYEISLLANYLEQLSRKSQLAPKEQIEDLGLKLLIDLLFYSTDNGYDRLWSVLNDN